MEKNNVKKIIIKKARVLIVMHLMVAVSVAVYARLEIQPGSTPTARIESKEDTIINRLQRHNRSITSYYGGIAANGYLQGQNFSATGSIWSDHLRDRLKLRFEDLIFKAPITVFLMQGDKITLYYPAQEKTVVTNKKDFKPAYDAGLPLTSDLLLPMLQGKFYLPILPEHKSYDASSSKLILADNKYIINYFLGENGFPQRAVYQNRTDNQRVIFVYKKYRGYGEAQIPHLVQIKPPGSNDYLDINITWLNVNKPIGNVWNLR